MPVPDWLAEQTYIRLLLNPSVSKPTSRAQMRVALRFAVDALRSDLPEAVALRERMAEAWAAATARAPLDVQQRGEVAAWGLIGLNTALALLAGEDG